jgi:hypothetical protein
MSNDATTDLVVEGLKINPEAIIALFKVQAIYAQRRKDADVPKAELRVANLTQEQAQRIADELCCYVQWGSEYLAPKINA